MFNFKISLVLLTAVLAITAGSLVVNNEFIVDVLQQDMVHDLQVAREVALRSAALDVHGQAAITDEVSRWPKFAEKLVAPYADGIDGQDDRHQAVWEELNVWHEKLLARSKEDVQPGLEDRRPFVPDEMFVLDAAGSVIARFSDYAWWGNNVAAELPVVLSVGQTGQTARDFWSPPGGGMLQVTVAPLFGDTVDPAKSLPRRTFLGSVVLGFTPDSAEAQRLARLLGTEVVFMYGGRATAGSIDVDLIEQLQREVIDKNEVKTTGRLGPDTVRLLRGRPWQMTAGLYASYGREGTAGFILMLDRASRLQPVATMNTYIPLAGGGVFLLLLILTAVIIHNYIRPFELLDQGIHEIINGNLDYTFPLPTRDTLHGNMAHSLNLMACTLLGKPIPGDDDTPGEAATVEGEAPAGWKDPLFIDEVSQVRRRPDLVGLPSDLLNGRRVGPPTPNPLSEGEGELRVERIEAGSMTQELAIETEEAYFRRLFDEYLTARRETGEGIQGVTQEKFVERLRSSERQLRIQLGCRMVRFRVQKKDGRVTLKPIPME